VLATNDTSPRSQYEIWMENHVWSFLGRRACEQWYDYIVLFFCNIIHLFPERVVTTAFEIVTRLNKANFQEIATNGAFADMTVCITDFCKSGRYQKINLLAIAMLRNLIPMMLNAPEFSLSVPTSEGGGANDEAAVKYWYPLLFSFYDIIMNGEDLEVRQM
jgi:hypothetical protein